MGNAGTTILMIALLINLSGCDAGQPTSSSSSSSSSSSEIPVKEVKQELESVLKAWYPRIVDETNGGYWTNFEFDWTRSEDQQKMLVTQARGLWTAARAAGRFPDVPEYRSSADHGYQFLTTVLWDPTDGGFFQLFPFKTEAEEFPQKLVYGNAFALYALAEYAKINSSPEVLSWVEKAFDWLEERSHDKIHLGYNNVIFSADIQEKAMAGELKKEEISGWGGPYWKDQNSSIHLLEALTTTYQVLPTEKVRLRLEEMLVLVRDRMVSSNGSLALYFTQDWQPIDHKDSTRQFILENQNFDHRSFGHDIETAFLLVDAAQVLYGEPDDKTLTVGKKLLDHSLKYGFDQHYYGIFDRGYFFNGQEEVEIINSQKAWWAEAEAWHALVLFSRLFPDEPLYPKAAAAMWDYMKKELVDYEHGGWYNKGLDINPENKKDRKAHQWKGAYHNGRALIRVLEYAERE